MLTLDDAYQLVSELPSVRAVTTTKCDETRLIYYPFRGSVVQLEVRPEGANLRVDAFFDGVDRPTGEGHGHMIAILPRSKLSHHKVYYLRLAGKDQIPSINRLWKLYGTNRLRSARAKRRYRR